MLKVQSKAPQWEQHQCHIAVCSERMVTIDGNEKLTRAMCAAPSTKSHLVQCCSHSISGGKHQIIAPFTSILFHQHKIRRSHSVRIPLHPQGIRLTMSDAIGSLPDADSDTGCHKPGKVTKFFDR